MTKEERVQIIENAIITSAPEIMPPMYQRAAHWEKSRVIILLFLLSHNLE